MLFRPTLLFLALAAQRLAADLADDCVDSTTAAEINRLLRNGDVGTSVALCPSAQITIDPHKEPITFTAPYQSLYTRGYPGAVTRATIIIENSDGRVTGYLSTAIDASCDRCQGASIRSLHVDGGRDHLGELEGADALIRLGGKKSNAQLLKDVEAFGARGFAVVHVDEGAGTCRNVTIVNNNIHSSGNAPLDAFLTSDLARLRNGPPAYRGRARPGTWTDGISVACSNPIISTNIVRDVSGAGIILRGAAGAQVHHNVVLAQDRDMLVGISIVANEVFKQDPEDQRPIYIRENRIHAAQAMIRIGISTGSGAWSTDEEQGSHQIPFGSSIVQNRLTSLNSYYGYAMALSNAMGLQVLDNAVSASIWGAETNACLSHPAFVPPTPLLRDPRSVTFAPTADTGAFQPSFVDRHFGFLLCVGPGSASSSLELARHSIGPSQGEMGQSGAIAGLLLQQMHPSLDPVAPPMAHAHDSFATRKNSLRKAIRRGGKSIERHIAPDGTEFAVAKDILRKVDRATVERKAQQYFGVPKNTQLKRTADMHARRSSSGAEAAPEIADEKVEVKLSSPPPPPPPVRESRPPPEKPLPPLGMRRSRRGMAGAIAPPFEQPHHHHPYEAAKRRGFR